MNREEEYVVVNYSRRVPRTYYTDSRKDAEEKYNRLCNDGKSAEILFGTPGHYETIKKLL